MRISIHTVSDVRIVERHYSRQVSQDSTNAILPGVVVPITGRKRVRKGVNMAIPVALGVAAAAAAKGGTAAGLGSGFWGGLMGAGSSIFGGLWGSNTQEKLTQKQINLQREFAQHGIQWRVEDAKRAGIHPAAALGAFPTSYNPIVMEDPLGRSISDAGQDISGAVSRMQSADDRLSTRLSQELIRSQIRENDMRALAIESDIKRKDMETGPNFPMVQQDGSGQAPMYPIPPTGYFKLDIPTRFNARTDDPSGEPGVSPAWEEVQFPGFKMKLPSGKGQSVFETWSEMPAYEKWGWIMHNAQTQGHGWLDKYIDFMVTGATMQDRFKDVKPILPMNDTEKSIRRSLDKALGAGRKYLNMTPRQIEKNFFRR